MGFTWKSKEQKRYKKYGKGWFTVSRTERFMAPDRIDKVTMWWLGKRVTIWERAK